jgi:exonuclease SbcC
MNSLGTEYRKLQDENRDLETRNSLLRRLSEQVRGVSPPKISLNRYFLARRLEEVLVQATRRLTLLSRGRFVLKRRDEGRTAAAQAGLDLLVSDAWTGTERPVNTLSGGQLFMASLSLALGLADVVQARSGGVRLEALFIDEGFGTLDDDALQGVLAVLNDLRENRMVGVISHVPELKRQIADRIEVSAAGTGSKITMVHGD